MLQMCCGCSSMQFLHRPSVRPNCLVLMQSSAQQQQCRNATPSKGHTSATLGRVRALVFVLGQPEIKSVLIFRRYSVIIMCGPFHIDPVPERIPSISSRSSISPRHHLISFTSSHHRRLRGRACLSCPKSGWIVITFRYRSFLPSLSSSSASSISVPIECTPRHAFQLPCEPDSVL